MENKKENKVWIGDDEIVYVKMARAVVEEDAYNLLRDIKKILQELSKKAKILIDITTDSVIRSSSFRKRIGDEISNIAKDVGFEKVAIYGGNIVTRTIASFVILASGQKNFRVFSDRRKALKWLKGP